jgi:hypothetical protein
MAEKSANTKRVLADMPARIQDQPNRIAAEDWFKSLGINLVDVWFLCADGTWLLQKQVDDEDTIFETIGMPLERVHRTGYALRAYHGRWELTGPARKVRYYDTREAAEMVAIHNG